MDNVCHIIIVYWFIFLYIITIITKCGSKHVYYGMRIITLNTGNTPLHSFKKLKLLSLLSLELRIF